MDLQKLRYFVVLAEELHFGRAAARLYLSQPALSNAIRALERSLGVSLFERTSRRVELTAAGTTLLPQAVQVIADADLLLGSVRQHRSGADGASRLRLAFVGQAANELTPTLIRDLTQMHPQVAVELRQVPAWEIVEQVKQDAAEVAVLRLPLDTRDLVVAPLFEESRVAVVPADHWAARADRVCLDQLFDEPWVVSAADDPEQRAFTGALRQRAGKPFLPGPTVRSIDEYLEAVQAHQGIGLAPLSAARYYGRPGVVYVPVPDAEPSVVALAWSLTSAGGTTWGPRLRTLGRTALANLPHTDPPLMREVPSGVLKEQSIQH